MPPSQTRPKISLAGVGGVGGWAHEAEILGCVLLLVVVVVVAVLVVSVLAMLKWVCHSMLHHGRRIH